MSATKINESNQRHAPLLSAGAPVPCPEAQVVTVLLVDDDCAASYSLWALLNWQPGIRVCATAESAVEAIGLVRRLRPDVCLVSAALEGGEGVRLAHRITELPEPSRVIIYTEHAGQDLAAMGAIAGAADAVWRYGDADQLARTIKATAARGLAAGVIALP
ncbi:MAG: response regulator [Actinomycetota bacterium]|nr:response regulator [Actinomycetota bacterium]